MKAVWTILSILYSFNVSAQKFALIDRDFKKPIIFTDSVTINQVSKGYFPINVKDFDSLFANIIYLIDELKNIQRAKFKSYKIKSGSTTIQITTVPHAYGDAYNILLITSVNNLNAEYLLSNNQDLNKKATKKLNSFMNFIKKDSEIMVNEFKEYQPIIFDATVYIQSN